MVSKKTNKVYCRTYPQKKADLYKANNATRKKNERERRKYLEPKMYEVFKKKEAARISKCCLKKDVREITGQLCNVSLRNNTNHVFSIFSKTNFEPKC